MTKITAMELLKQRKKTVNKEIIEVQVGKDLISRGKHKAKINAVQITKGDKEFTINYFLELTEPKYKGRKIEVPVSFSLKENEYIEELDSHARFLSPHRKILHPFYFILRTVGKDAVLTFCHVAKLKAVVKEISPGIEIYYE